jgi:uncharacterized membrane protein YqjE
MTDTQPDTPETTSPGLIAGVVGIARNGFGLLVSRIELAALELAEVRSNLVKLLLVVALGIVAAWFAIAYWTVLVVMLSWQSLGWKILLILAAMFTLLTGSVFLYARSMLKQGKLSMPETMAELRSDRDNLMPKDRASPAE